MTRTSDQTAQTATIRRLNDAFRQTFRGGRVVISHGIGTLSNEELLTLFEAIQHFDAFDQDNNPHDEHDFGRVTFKGEEYLWKIDYYDTALRHLSPDPANPAKTRRVLTIITADDY